MELVLRSASWGHVRVPVALAPIDPQSTGPQHLLVRPRLQDCVPPAWVRPVVGVADAGCAAHATRHLSTAIHSTSVFAMPRSRKFTHGTQLRDLVPPLPKSWYSRRASHQPDGRRRDDWVVTRRATRHHRGEVTRVVSNKRRHDGPQGGTSIVTTLTAVRAGAVLSM